jgi:hypothetical protein
MRPVRGWRNRGLDNCERCPPLRFSKTGSVDGQCFHGGCLKAHFTPDQAVTDIRITAVLFRL